MFRKAAEKISVCLLLIELHFRVNSLCGNILRLYVGVKKMSNFHLKEKSRLLV